MHGIIAELSQSYPTLSIFPQFGSTTHFPFSLIVSISSLDSREEELVLDVHANFLNGRLRLSAELADDVGVSVLAGPVVGFEAKEFDATSTSVAEWLDDYAKFASMLVPAIRAHLRLEHV